MSSEPFAAPQAQNRDRSMQGFVRQNFGEAPTQIGIADVYRVTAVFALCGVVKRVSCDSHHPGTPLSTRKLFQDGVRNGRASLNPSGG